MGIESIKIQIFIFFSCIVLTNNMSAIVSCASVIPKYADRVRVDNCRVPNGTNPSDVMNYGGFHTLAVQILGTYENLTESSFNTTITWGTDTGTASGWASALESMEHIVLNSFTISTTDGSVLSMDGSTGATSTALTIPSALLITDSAIAVGSGTCVRSSDGTVYLIMYSFDSTGVISLYCNGTMTVADTDTVTFNSTSLTYAKGT